MQVTKQILTQQKLKASFNYNEHTGMFERYIAYKGCWKECNSLDKGGYVIFGFLGSQRRAHRMAWLYTYGELPLGDIDHIDGNPANNSISNLRVVTPAENAKNTKVSSRSKTGVSGVNDCPNYGFRSRIRSAVGVDVLLYQGGDFFEACCARKSAEIKYNYHPNHGKR